ANAEKLGRVPADRRELWIWCETMHALPALFFPPPRGTPSMAAEITAVWVAIQTDPETCYWRFGTGAGWTFGTQLNGR
ncbi:MAG: hypothetical protein WA938_01920, partial [Candidatus Dormiibacterota bacterium]